MVSHREHALISFLVIDPGRRGWVWKQMMGDMMIDGESSPCYGVVLG
jgi:hypothetical protein